MVPNDMKCVPAVILDGLRPRRRRCYRMLEAAGDAGAWVLGLMAAAWVTRDLAAAQPFARLAATEVVIAILVAGTGLLAGLYRGRYQRGSLDEVISVGRAACGTALVLAVLGGVLVRGQRAPLATGGSGQAVVQAAPGLGRQDHRLRRGHRRHGTRAQPGPAA